MTTMPPRTLAIVAVAVMAGAMPVAAQSRDAATATGDPSRGKALYEETYRCYACHGYRGETTPLAPPLAPRLVPMARSQEAFVTYLRKPATPGMPAYAHAPPAHLGDIYAYLRSLQSQSPSVEQVPLLKALRDRVQR